MSFSRSARSQPNTQPRLGNKQFPREMESVSLLNSVGVLKKLYRCKLCGHTANRSNNLKTHLQTHTRLVTYQCGKCGRRGQCRLDDKDWLKRAEIFSAGGKKRFRCRDCGHTTDRSYNLKKHLQSHFSGNDPVVCRGCGETCKPAAARQYHVKEVEIVDERDANGRRRKLFRCRLCRAVYPRRSNLHAHIVKHKPVGFLVCHVCGGEFLGEKSLRDHERIKHPKNDVPCPYCLESFGSQDALYAHSKIHMTDLDKK